MQLVETGQEYKFTASLIGWVNCGRNFCLTKSSFCNSHCPPQKQLMTKFQLDMFMRLKTTFKTFYIKSHTKNWGGRFQFFFTKFRVNGFIRLQLMAKNAKDINIIAATAFVRFAPIEGVA